MGSMRAGVAGGVLHWFALHLENAVAYAEGRGHAAGGGLKGGLLPGGVLHHQVGAQGVEAGREAPGMKLMHIGNPVYGPEFLFEVLQGKAPGSALHKDMEGFQEQPGGAEEYQAYYKEGDYGIGRFPADTIVSLLIIG